MERAYYNEHEPYAAQWLRNLIAENEIAAGDVDERSIEDVQPDDLRGYTQCHFFAGIGGWSVALRLADWPDDRSIWTGSCPCQPFSEAGERKAKADPRHLWPAWFRLISELRPDCIFGEQVPEAIKLGWLDEMAADLEACEYAVGSAVLSACVVEARQERERLWFVARANGFAPKWSTKPRMECNPWPVEPNLPRVAHGIPEQPFFRRALRQRNYPSGSGRVHRDRIIRAFFAGANMSIKPIYKPSECPHCEYDRRFPGFEEGGWIQQDNNGPIVSCPMCNDDGSHLPSTQGW